jgi:hypothetical protein
MGELAHGYRVPFEGKLDLAKRGYNVPGTNVWLDEMQRVPGLGELPLGRKTAAIAGITGMDAKLAFQYVCMEVAFVMDNEKLSAEEAANRLRETLVPPGMIDDYAREIIAGGRNTQPVLTAFHDSVRPELDLNLVSEFVSRMEEEIRLRNPQSESPPARQGSLFGLGSNNYNVEEGYDRARNMRQRRRNRPR